MSHKILYLILGFYLFLFGSVTAQNTTFVGVVKDSTSGIGIGGITVKVLGTSLETTTASDGRYVIQNAPRNSPLLFGGSNYATKIAAACSAKPGDVNGTGAVNLADLIYLVNFVFKGGAEPNPICRGNANGSSGYPNLSDLIYLVNFVFKGGPEPVKSGECCL